MGQAHLAFVLLLEKVTQRLETLSSVGAPQAKGPHGYSVSFFFFFLDTRFLRLHPTQPLHCKVVEEPRLRAAPWLAQTSLAGDRGQAPLRPP